MGVGLLLAVLAAMSGFKGTAYALQRIEARHHTIEAKHVTWVGVGLIVWIGVWAVVCNQVAGT